MLASNASIKGKKVIARARALQTDIRILDRPKVTPPLHFTFSITPLEHGEPNQSIRHDLQLRRSGRADSGYQFKGGELSKIIPGNGVGGSQIGEGLEGAGEAERIT